MNPTAENLAEQNDVISEGNEVIYPGLFVNHAGRGRNVPILRSGTIALLGSPDEPVGTRRYGDVFAHLIESRSVGGLSGSPVFVRTGPTRLIGDSSVTSGVQYWMLGLIHGHYPGTLSESDSAPTDSDGARAERINQGIAAVIPTSQILKVFDGNEEIQRTLAKALEQAMADRTTHETPLA